MRIRTTGRAAGILTSSVVLLSAAGVSAQGAGVAAIPTFTRDVAPILYRSCVACYRPGEMAPMSLVTYQDARASARAIRDRPAGRSMPPWFADPR